MADEFCLAAKKLSNEVGATVFCTQRTGHAGEHVARIGGYGAPVHRWSDEHECARCADLSPIETELIAQARLTAGFRSTMKDLDFAERINLYIEANAVQRPETPQ